ncbi:MAG TPA: metalloregulator ArsR/SmtB family transcription factor [Stellaceae bacterium]|nr:metalloregulator ArsR/SmtB family transcription factor [Stellaceae bacterium]
MLNQSTDIDLLFQALADPTRRLMIELMSGGPVAASNFAKPCDISLPAVLQHLKLLEGCGLVRSEKRGRVRHCMLETAAFARIERWVEERRMSWHRQLDQLEQILAEDETGDSP